MKPSYWDAAEGQPHDSHELAAKRGTSGPFEIRRPSASRPSLLQLEVIGINDSPWGARPNPQKVDSQDRS